MPVALITGASSGIGEQFAYSLAREGYGLALTARRDDRLQGVAAQARKLGAPDVRTFGADLSLRTAPEELYRAVAAAGLKIELLVNNAGFGTRGRFDTLALERELEQIDLNITALAALCRLWLPEMVAAGRGSIINVASTAGYQPVPYMSTYAATKAFVVSFSLALHYELDGTGVNVMALCPGATRTEFQAVARNGDTFP
jgi:short-subunit dehydrogenase